MKDFLAKLPPLLATLSKAFLNALMEQMREVARTLQMFLRFLGRLLFRLAKRLWAIYYRIETQILGVIVDLGLAVLSLRQIFLLLGIGIVLIYFKQWIIAVAYVMVLSIAVFRFFRIDSKTIAREDEHHKQSRYTFIRLLRWPSRILASVALVYASWQFVRWRPLNVPWLHIPIVEVNNAEEIQKLEEAQRSERLRKTDDSRKAEENDRQRKNPSGDSASQQSLQSISSGEKIDGNAESESTKTHSGITNLEAKDFVIRYLNTQSRGNVSELLTLYAGVVNYFNKGDVTQALIYKDKKSYYERWSEVDNHLNGDVIIENTQDDNIKVLKFSINFRTHNLSRKVGISGKAINTIKIRKINGVIKIIDEKQEVLSRETI